MTKREASVSVCATESDSSVLRALVRSELNYDVKYDVPAGPRRCTSAVTTSEGSLEFTAAMYA